VKTQLLAFYVSAGTRDNPGDVVFLYSVQGVGVVFLFSEMVDTDVFGDTVEPRRERRLPAKVVDATIRPHPRFLRQVFGGLVVCDTSVDMVEEAWVVFGNKGGKRFYVPLLCPCDVMFFVEN